MLQFWMKCCNFGYNVPFLDKMLLFWMKCYNVVCYVTLGQFLFLIWLMGYISILIWPIGTMATWKSQGRSQDFWQADRYLETGAKQQIVQFVGRVRLGSGAQPLWKFGG